MSYIFFKRIWILFFIFSCTQNKINDVKTEKRFFSESSFWNQPIPENAEADPRNKQWIEMLKEEPTGEHFSVSYSVFTIPVYEVDSTTPLQKVGFHYLSDKEKEVWKTSKERFGHGPGFGMVPIPEDAIPDPEDDLHMALVDYSRRIAWDMWGCRKLPDGSWISKTGMTYSLDGEGVFNISDFNILDGESVHLYGPSRAPGVPAIAGLIMYDEVMSGEIKHKLSCASRYVGYKEHVYPAIWTDGPVVGGIPEGAVIQLDPKLDLSKFDLTKEEWVVAEALQKYGMVLVDGAGGQPIYAEGLYGHPGKSWKGKLREWEKAGINSIPFDHYRILKVENTKYTGDAKRKITKDFYRK